MAGPPSVDYQGPCPREHVWAVHRPGYGDSDGLPFAVFSTRDKARVALLAYNAPWDGVLREGRPIRPYKLRRVFLDPPLGDRHG